MRVARRDLGQLDVELKFRYEDYEEEGDTGLAKLQRIKIREMCDHGAPAIGLVYCEPRRLFFVTHLLRCVLPLPVYCVKRGEAERDTIDGEVLFWTARRFLDDHGYQWPYRS